MKQEYIDYAKEISVIGDQPQVAANLFGELSKKKAKSIEEFKAIVEDYKVAKNGFVKCKENLEKIAPPKVIIEEHTELDNTYNKLIESVEIHLTALYLNDGSVDFDLISKGFKLNATAIKEVGDVTDKIATVFQNN